MTMDLSRTTSDGRVFYASQPYAVSHPDRLATVATLVGLKPASPAECRLLELGCADGGNILPLAEILPQSRLIGVDQGKDEIRAGQQAIRQLELSNIELRQADILDIDTRWGQFDYIICHGVFSWVSRQVQDKVLSICATNLAPTGVAYLNYNTYPGWHLQSLIRDLLRLAAQPSEVPAERVAAARQMAERFRRWWMRQNQPLGHLLASQLGALLSRPDSFLYQAFLNVANEPVYFQQLVERAAAHGLQYLGDAQSGTRWTTMLPADTRQELVEAAAEPVRREQLVDFLIDCTSRYSLFCHRGVPLEPEISSRRLDNLYVAGQLACDPPLPGLSSRVFRAPNGQTVRSEDPATLAALTLIARRWPEPWLWQDLRGQVEQQLQAEPDEQWLETLLDCYRAGMVQLNVRPPDFTLTVTDRPQATRLARHQAAAGETVTNLLHRVSRLDQLQRQVLRLLDGQHDCAQIIAALAAEPSSGLPTSAPPEQHAQIVQQTLTHLAAEALLLRPKD